MDTDKEAEQSQPKDDGMAQKDSSSTKTVEEGLCLKRKLDKDTEEDSCDKRMKVETDDKTAGDTVKEASEEQSHAEIEDEAKSKAKVEESATDGGKDDKSDGADNVKTESAEQSIQDVKMDDEKIGEHDTPEVNEVKKENIKNEGKENLEEKMGEEKQEEGMEESGSKPVSAAETEEQTEVVQRRYPTRSRRTDEKTGSELVKANGSKSGESQSTDKEYQEGKRASSVKSDNGSDKENNNEAAMDLSNAGTPDVIMLSDEEDTEQRKQSQEQVAEMKKLVRHLQTQLRNEEAKLVLLKKLRQSQLAPQVQEHPQIPNSNSSQMSKQSVQRQQGGPPPLVRGGQQGRGSGLHMQQQQGRASSQGQLRNMQGPPPLVSTPRVGTNNANGHSSQGLRNAQHLNQHGSSSHRPVQQQQTAQHQQAATPPQQPVDTQTPAQRQAAAKLALRKQLEKTLLQIPPPKPPAPEMNFIPSLACPDFVLLLGLEEVVNHIIDLQLIARGQKSPDEKFICNPFTCVQCGTDYTPVWKREKPGSKNVICEHCVTWNQKRALKQEHTNRLKSAFVKALQQEQEIERMQAQTPSNPSTPTPSATPPTSMPSAPPQALAAAAAASNVAAATAMSMNPASFRPSAEQVRQHHSFLQQAHQAQLRAGQPLPGLQGFGARFPYNLPYVKQADLQRQYLLDMIPRAGMPWK